jgi:acetyl-CoA C-acetyltransferase
MALNARDVVIVEALRTPIGRRNGGLSSMHPADLLGVVLEEIVNRTGIDPSQVGQLVGGCVSQVGEQTFNIARTAWLAAGLPLTVAATTVDSQCGSSQQATSLAASLVGGGAVDVAIGCGVETMSRVPIGSAMRTDFGVPTPKSYFSRYEMTSQFEGAERIAEKWGISREDCDRFGLLSQERAIKAWAEDRFAGQIVEVDAPDLDEEGKPKDTTHRVSKDEGLRETSLEKLATLKPVARENGVHTAGSSSQISDGASAVLMMTAEKAKELKLTPKARVVDHCHDGTAPVLMLTGAIDATEKLMSRNKDISLGDIDVFEVNEAFASVVLAWAKECKIDMEKANPNGGAIALGHPLGGTGGVLITKALHELHRTGGRYGLISMCCGGGLGTGTLIERL